MKRALIKPEICKCCDSCAVEEQCSMHAIIREDSTEKPWVDFYRCSGCLKCKRFCRNSAIEEIVHPCTGTGRIGW